MHGVFLSLSMSIYVHDHLPRIALQLCYHDRLWSFNGSRQTLLRFCFDYQCLKLFYVTHRLELAQAHYELFYLQTCCMETLGSKR